MNLSQGFPWDFVVRTGIGSLNKGMFQKITKDKAYGKYSYALTEKGVALCMDGALDWEF
jgi:hypothetical protein